MEIGINVRRRLRDAARLQELGGLGDLAGALPNPGLVHTLIRHGEGARARAEHAPFAMMPQHGLARCGGFANGCRRLFRARWWGRSPAIREALRQGRPDGQSNAAIEQRGRELTVDGAGRVQVSVNQLPKLSVVGSIPIARSN